MTKEQTERGVRSESDVTESRSASSRVSKAGSVADTPMTEAKDTPSKESASARSGASFEPDTDEAEQQRQ